MTKEEAIKIINCYDIGFYDLSGEKIPADKLSEAFDMAIEALKERPIGHWIDDGDCSICSKCHEAYGLTLLGQLYTPNFCPNCGADMRGEEDETANE